MDSHEPDFIVVGAKVALGPLRRDLAADYARWMNEPDVRHGLNQMGIATPQSQEKWVEDNLEQGAKSEPEVVEFTVYDRISFGHHEYDERGDVLYLSVADYQGPPARAYASPEGHAAEYDGSNHVIALTLVNVRWLLDRDDELTITWPAGHVQADELAAALLPAA